jgi:cytochrome o ubiquinol oxidase subunit IV
MSQDQQHAHHAHGPHGDHADHGDHGHHEGHDDTGYHATLKGYVTGFIFSVLLTAIPFALVMMKVPLSPRTLGLLILLFGAVQMMVHMVYFLHLDTKIEGGWTALATIFTICLVVIMLSGSSWVMYHMNANMMPKVDAKTMHDMP